MSLHGKDHASFYRNMVWQYVLQAIKYLLPLVTLPYLTRVLEPDGYAVYAYVLSFMSFAQVLVDFGFNLSGTKAIAKAGDRAEEERVLGAITQARILLCGIVGFGVACMGCVIPLIRENAGYAALAYIAVCGRCLAPDFLFQGKEQMGPISLRYLASKGTSTVLTFIFVRSASDLLWIPVLDIVASCIALGWSFAAAKRLFRLKLRRAALQDGIEELRVSAIYCFSNMADVALNGVTTLLIGIAISDEVQISYWSLAMSAITAVQSLYTPITNSLYPHMVVGGDFSFAKRLTCISVPFVACGTVAFAALSPWIVSVLGGEGYAEAAPVLVSVSPVLFFSFYVMMLGWPVLGAMGKIAQLTTTAIISSVLSLTSLLAVTIVGAASLLNFALIRNAAEMLFCFMRVALCCLAARKRYDGE